MNQTEDSKTIGNASLALGVASAALVFGIGFCGLVGAQQGWLALAGTALWVCGASSAFLGFLGLILGVVGLFVNQSKATAVAGICLSFIGLCLFLLFLAAIGGA